MKLRHIIFCSNVTGDNLFALKRCQIVATVVACAHCPALHCVSSRLQSITALALQTVLFYKKNSKNLFSSAECIPGNEVGSIHRWHLKYPSCVLQGNRNSSKDFIMCPIAINDMGLSVSSTTSFCLKGTVSRDVQHFLIKKKTPPAGPKWKGKNGLAQFFIFAKIFAKKIYVRL